MKEKNKSKFYVKSSIIAIILILLGTALFFAVNNNTGILKISSIKEKMTEESMKRAINDGVVYINTEAEFKLFVDEFNKNKEELSYDITVYIQNDLDLNSYINWNPINLRDATVNKLTIEGQGHVIKNMRIYEQDGAGLIVDTNGNHLIVIKKLGITKSAIYSNNSFAGAFVGGDRAHADIFDCYVTDSTITAKNYSAGSIIGCGEGTIENCYSTSNVKVESNVEAGGIAGEFSGIIKNCYNTGIVQAIGGNGEKIDGICPYPTVQIENCYYQEGTNSAADNKATKKSEAAMQISNFKDLLNNGSNHWKFPNPEKTSTLVEMIEKMKYKSFDYPVLSWQPAPEPPTVTVIYGTEGENGYYTSDVDIQISVNGDIYDLDDSNFRVYIEENGSLVWHQTNLPGFVYGVGPLHGGDVCTRTETVVYGYDNGLYSIATKKIKIDKRAPVINAVTADTENSKEVTDNGWYNTGVKVNVTDDNKDNFDLYYKNRIDGTEYKQEGVEGTAYSDDGYYRVVAKDKAGNTSEIRFNIDNVEPYKPTLLVNGEKVEDNNAKAEKPWYDENVIIKFEGEGDNLSGVKQTYLTVSTSDAEDTDHLNEVNKNISWNEGEVYHVDALSYDNAGNISRSDQYYFKIDKTAPTDAKPTLTPSTNSITVQSKQEETGSGIDKIEYGYSTSENGNYTWKLSSDKTNKTDTITGLNDDTTYYVRTRMTDNVGHVTTSNATSVKTKSSDTTAPTITANPQNIQTYAKSGTITLTISENVTEANLQYKWTTDSNTAPSNWDTTQIQEKNIASVTASGMTGEYYLWVGQVTDGHGNKSNVTHFGPYKFDNEAPTINSVSEKTTEYTKGPVTLTATAQDQKSGIVAWQFSTDADLRGNEDGWQEEKNAPTNSITKTIQVTDNGQYYFYVKDAAGNVKRSENAINVYNIEKEDGITPPTITATVNGENYKSGNYTKESVTLTVSEGYAKSGIKNYQYSKDGGQTWTDCASGNAITIADEGITTITARLKSNAGYYSQSSEPFVVNIDKTAPTCEITVTPDTSLTNDSRTIYTFKFSEPVVDFSESDITITGGGDGSTFTNVFLEDPLTNTEYTLIVNNGNNSKYTQKLTINANACHDRAGNGNESATNSIEVDRKKPTCAITAENVTNNITNSNQTTYKFTFDEGVEGFNADDIIITSGEKGTFSVTNNKEYTIIVNNADEIDTTEVVSIADGACTDVAGNPNTASSSNSIEVDRKRPTCEITTSKSSPTKDNTITYEIKFSETLKTNLTQNSITVANGNISSFSGSGDKYTVTVNGGTTGNQTISVKDNIVQDNAGNGNILASKSIEIDRSAPEIEKITKTPDSWTNGSVTLTIEGAKDQGAAGLDSAPYSFDGGSSWTANNSKVYTSVANNVTVKIKDKLGNVKEETVKIDKIDKTGPNIPTVTAKSSDWTNTAVTLTGSAQSTESKIKYYQFSTESNLTATSENWKEVTVNNSISETHTISDQTTGITTWYFYVKDEAGNVEKQSVEVKQDYTAPKVSFGNQGDSAYKKESNVNITLSDDGCGKIKQNSKLQYAWSKSNKEEPNAWQEAEITENKATATESGLTGEYYLWVKDGITDEVGNSTKDSVVSTSRFYFDNSAPEIIIKPDGQENLDGTAYTKTKNIDIEIKDNVALKSSSLSYAFDKSNVNEPNDWTNNISISNNTAKIENVGSGLTGVYYLWIKEGIEDNLNNETTKATVSEKAFYFDNTEPTINIEEPIVGAKEITAKVKAVENDSGLVKGSSYKYYIKSNDGNYVLEQTTDNTAYTFTGLNEGVNYSIKVEATDNAQNVGSITTSATTKVNVSSIDITPNPAEVKVGSTVQLTATVKPENADNKTVVWTSSDTSTATVSDSGLVTALSEGTVTITVTAEGGIKSTSTVTVNPREVTNGLTITDPSWTSGFASVTVTGNTNGNKIEYSINDENGVYKTLTNGTISGLSHGDTVYVRESDGVYYSPVKSKRIIDDKYPTLEVRDNATSWQNSYVTLTITSKDTESGLQEVKVNDDILTINNNTAKYTVTTNGTYEITAVDRAENKTSKTEQVTYIDTEKPEIEVEKDTEEFVKDGVKLIIRATDNQSGVKTVKVNDQDTTNQNGIFEYTATNNDSYIIKVTDNAGNVATYTEIVDNIDDIAPELSVRYRPNYEFNTVTVTVLADEPIQAVSGWKLSSDKMILTKTYSQNKKDNITVKDLVGNAKGQEINVDQIDDVKLSVTSVTYDPQKDKMTSDRVRVTIQVNKQVLAVDGWSMSDGGTTLTKDFYNNEVERVILYDLVGNSIPQVISVTQIDNKAPKVVDVIYSTKDPT